MVSSQQIIEAERRIELTKQIGALEQQVADWTRKYREKEQEVAELTVTLTERNGELKVATDALARSLKTSDDMAVSGVTVIVHRKAAPDDPPRKT